jgi:hypothetical protein
MSEPITCEFCGSKSKTKALLVIHQKGAAKCINMQIKKLGKPLYEASLKKVENKKEQPKKESESEDESEEDENQEIPLSSESDDDIHLSESEPEINFKEEPIKSKFSIKTNLFKKQPETITLRNTESTPRNTETTLGKSLIHEPNNEVNTKEIESKLSLILNTLNSKDNKVLDEIKKLREELKQREEEAQKRDENIRKMISKLEKVIGENNPSSIIEIIKRIQAEVESKDELLQIFKEDLEETCDKYYELYKKLKDVKYDMEEMVYGKEK